jgi:Phage stabilisation protein
VSSVGKIVDLFGAATASKSFVVTRQRRLNVYFENRKDRDKTRIACYGTPGLVAAFNASTPLSQPLRAFFGTQTALFLVAYNQFQQINASGVASFTGSMGTTAGNCSIAYNATQVVIVDGSAAYLYTPPSTFSTIGGSFPNGAKTVTFVSGFFVSEAPGSQQFYVSNAGDGSTWTALSTASAEAYSDNILATDNLLGNLALFCQEHIELWQPAGLYPQPFAAITSAVYEYGLAAIFSRAHVNQSLIFLGQTKEGQVQVMRFSGYTLDRISDPDIENIINGFSIVSDAVALVYEVDEHKFYQLSFPTANRTFLFDTSTGLWADAQTGTSLVPVRHTANLSAYFGGVTYLSDYATNQVYTMSPTAYTDNGTTIVREIVTKHVLSDFNRIRISSVYLDMETGVGLQSGQGSNPQIMLQYSKDNGRTWSAERWVSSGLVGQYLARVIWRRFGCTRDAVFRIRMTDPVKFVVTQAALKIKVPRAAA